jgi:sugar/nucleoside kinase (ribokinase family)
MDASKQRERPTIAVLGTLTRDTTTYADGTQSENLGGLLYTLSTLAHLFAGAARILPVANVGEDLYPRVMAALEMPGVDPGLVRRVPVPNNHVFLTYRDAETRDEVLVGLVPPISVEHARRAAGFDWVLVNLTSGRDLELATLQELRRAHRGTLQLDIHSLTLDIAPGGLRVLRRPEGWEEWVACADWVQVNETEANLLGEGVAPAAFASRVLNLGPRGVLVTLGARGCYSAWREEDGTRRELELGTPHHPHPAYPTGCGDVFGASFAVALLHGAPIAAAVEFANGVASTKAGLEPYVELERIRDHAAEHWARCQQASG